MEKVIVVEDKSIIKIGDKLFSREGYVFNEGHTKCDYIEEGWITMTVTKIFKDYETGVNIKGVIDKERSGNSLKDYDYVTFSEFSRILLYQN